MPASRRACRPLVLAAGLTLAVTSGAMATPAAMDEVETLAGPGFCDGPATRDGDASSVRALAVDPAGRVFVDTGPRSEGSVSRSGETGVIQLATEEPVDPEPATPAQAARQRRPATGRLMADGRGGVLVAAGARIIDVDVNDVRLTVAGDPAAPPGATGASTGDGGPAAAARFSSVRSMAGDEDGNLYVADEVDPQRGTFRVRVINRGTAPVTYFAGTADQLTVGPGSIATVAGTAGGEATRGAASDGGPALAATLQGVPPSLAVSGGRLYIASHWTADGVSAETIRVVNLTGRALTASGVLVSPGAIETVAVSTEGRRGPRSFSLLPGVAAGPRGDLYLADVRHDRVLHLDPEGGVVVIAGGASAGYNGNGRPALGALLDHPGDVKLGPGGDVFVSDGANGQVRVIDGAGTIRAAPGGGNGLTWRCQNGGELPQPGGPTAVAAAPDGSVYIANATGQQVKRIDRAGRVGTVAGSARAARSCRPKGSGCAGYRGDGGPATAALLDTPSALALRPPGTLYVYDSGNARVRVINVGGDPVTANGITVEPGAIETVAGTGHTGLAGDGGSALRAEIGNSPGQLAVSARGDVFIGDPSRGSVRRVGATGTISTVAGHGASEDLQRCCSLPVGLAADGSGNLYVAASGPPPEIRFLNLGAGPVTVQRARVEPGSSLVLKAEAEPPDPSGGGLAGLGAIAVDRRGTVYAVHDLLQDDHVDSIDDSGHLTTVIGYPESGFNGDGRLGRLTLLNSPGGLSLDPCGNVVLADTGNDRVRRWRIAPACRLVAEEKMGRGNGHGVPLVIGALAVGATLLLAVAGLLASHGRRAASTRGGRGLFA